MTVARSEGLFGPTPEGARVLDVGAGDSPFAGELAGRVRIAVALDLDYAHRAPPSGVAVVGDVTCLPFRAGAFDEIHASYVLMHLPDPAAGVQELVRATAPGGRVCITPAWPRRSVPPSVSVVERRRRPPRRRSSLVLARDLAVGDAGWVAAVSDLCAPRAGWRVLGSLAMALVIGVRGTPRVPVGRVARGPAAGELAR